MKKTKELLETEQKATRGAHLLKQEKQREFSSGEKKKNGSLLLLLAPANMLGLLASALAVVGICALARGAAARAQVPLPTDSGTSGVTVTTPAESSGTPAVSDTTEAFGEPTTTPVSTAPSEPDPIPPVGTAVLPDTKKLHPVYDLSSALLGSSVDSDYAILVDLAKNCVVASKYSNVRLYPASMTKVMTILTAVLHIPESDFYTKTFRMTNEIITPLVWDNATRAGFVGGEDVLLIDYLYGTILPSGADATTALALYCAGSEEAFAEMMNETAAELGLKDTHFTNASGLHDPNHYTTAYEMAVIMRAALSNELCRKVLSTVTYTTHSTVQNPDGLTLYSTGLSRLSPYNCRSYSFAAAKTGFTPEAKQCLVSLIRTSEGKEFVFVCAHASEKYMTSRDTDYVAGRYCVS